MRNDKRGKTVDAKNKEWNKESEKKSMSNIYIYIYIYIWTQHFKTFDIIYDVQTVS